MENFDYNKYELLINNLIVAPLMFAEVLFVPVRAVYTAHSSQHHILIRSIFIFF